MSKKNKASIALAELLLSNIRDSEIESVIRKIEELEKNTPKE